MSLSSPLLTSLPTTNGVPYAVEPIDGTGKLRITRRFSVASDLVANGALAELIEPYGTADGVGAGTVSSRTPEARRIWSDAYLVELRVLPAPVAGSPEGDGSRRIVEKIYEQTPYERTTGSQTDAQGALLSTDRTVVCATGQALPGAASGYSRVVLGASSDAGRTVYQVRDVRGQGDLRTSYNEDGEGVIVESGSYATMTEPADPTPGAFDTWTKTPMSGYWRVDYSKPADAQLPAPGRVRRSRTAQRDGSVTESVTESGEAPACAASDYGTRTVLLTGESEFTRAGGIVGRTKQWLVLPVDRDEPAIVPWTQPGQASVGGSTDKNLVITPPVQRRLVGVRSMAWGASVTPVAPWQIESGFSISIGGTVKDASNKEVPYARDESVPNCIGNVTFAYTNSGTWNGLPIVSLVGAGSSYPDWMPTGETVLECGVRPYACALDTGVMHYEMETLKANL